MPLVELNENECAFVRDGALCRGSIDSHVVAGHSIPANPAEEMVLPRVTLSVAVSSMASADAVALAHQRQLEEAQWRALRSNPQAAAGQRVSVLPQGWSVSATQPTERHDRQRQRIDEVQRLLAAGMPQDHHLIEAIRDPLAPAEVSLQPTPDFRAAVSDMLAEADANVLAGLQDSLPPPAADDAMPETVSGLTDFRVGALGRAWLVSHFLTTSIPISAATTSRDVINLLNENVQQVLEEGADLFPYTHERFLRVMGYSRRQDFPPIEIAREHVGTIYFARNTRTLYWIADQPTTAGDDRQVYVQFVPRSPWPGDRQPSVAGTDPAPFTLPAGMTIPTRVVHGDPVRVSLPRPSSSGRNYRIQHVGRNPWNAAAERIDDQRVEYALHRALPSRILPANFHGVVTFENRAFFTPYDQLNDDARDRWFFFCRATGDLWRVCRITGGYECIVRGRNADGPAHLRGSSVAWWISHSGDFDNAGGVAGEAFNRQVDAVMALVTAAELPENFRGVTTFAHRGAFPGYDELTEEDTRRFYFCRSEGDLFRVTPFGSEFRYTLVASVVPPPRPFVPAVMEPSSQPEPAPSPSGTISTGNGVQVSSTNSIEVDPLYMSRRAAERTLEGMARPPQIPSFRPWPTLSPPRLSPAAPPVRAPIPVSDDRPRRLMLND